MKAFKIKNGLQASRYLLSSTTISGSTIDLSLGSMFSTTLSSDPAYTFTNPPASGVAQAFSLEVAGGSTNYVQDSFATNLYNGTGAAQTFNNGLDLSTDGGLVWIKWRSGALGSAPHVLVDTVRGVNKNLKTSSTDAEVSWSSVDSFTSTGFTLSQNAGPNGGTNYSGTSQVAWTFKKQAKFFDIVTYTGDGLDDRVLSHSLGSTPGMVIMKRTSSGTVTQGAWFTYHIGAGFSGGLSLNGTESAGYTYGSPITAASDTTVTINNPANNGNINASGATYVAYLFAHDTASDSRIKCGSYTGGGSTDVEVTLGWSPQWLLVRKTNATEDWFLVDNKRGFGDGAGADTAKLKANSGEGETTSSTLVATTATGFKTTADNAGFNSSGGNYIYMAIRGDAATDSAITWPTSIKWPAGVAPTTPVPGKKDLFTFLTTDGGTTYYGKKAAEGIA